MHGIEPIIGETVRLIIPCLSRVSTGCPRFDLRMLGESSSRQMSADPQIVASHLLTEVANELSSGAPVNLVAAVRKLLRASELLGWDDATGWWRNELSGCNTSSAPSHSYTSATIDYRSPLQEIYSSIAGASRSTSRATTRTEPLCHPLADLVLNGDVGFSWKTGKSITVPITKTVHGLPATKGEIHTEHITFPPYSVKTVLHRIEEQCFNFAIRSERLLGFGDRVSDVFGEYRSLAEDELGKIGIDENLAAIDANLRLGTVEGAKLAILGCRNILIALSHTLWQVPGLTRHPTLLTYDDKPLQLDSGQIKARLRAYLYERDVDLATRRGPTLIAGQLDRIADTLDQLYNLSSEQGKNDALVPEAKSAVLQTFFLIGEIARLTGFEPVTKLTNRPAT
jgi:hypothetical protein